MERLVSIDIRLAGVVLLGALVAGSVFGQAPPRELTVHLAQANNNSLYALVRAKFEPGGSWTRGLSDSSICGGKKSLTSSGTR